jgi:hypothetical protein
MLRRLIGDYLAAIWKDWLSRMTTIASLIFVVIGLAVRITEVGQARYWIAAAVACYIVASFQVWKQEQTTIASLRSEIASLKQAVEGLNQAEGVTTLTPEELTGIFKNRTTWQGQKLAATYIGKWMTVSGSVKDIERFREQIRVGFSVAKFADPTVIMYFENEFVEPVSALVKGDKITVRGQVVRIESSHVSLENCELVKF